MSLKQLYDPESFRKQGHDLIDTLADHLKNTISSKNDKVIDFITPKESYNFWKNDTSKNASELFSQILNGSIHVHHPNYMGHQVAVPAPISALGSLVSGLLNNGMAIYEMGAASTAIERVCIDFICKHLGYDENASGFLTSGGTLANLTALLSARAKQVPEIWSQGHKQMNLAIMVSEKAHYCIDRAARIMGLGKTGIISIPVDDDFKMNTDLLEHYYDQARNDGQKVIAIIGSACNTSTGSYDDLQSIGTFAQKNKIWFHVDGAHGAAVCFSNKFKKRIKGIELADSVTLDCHKMMMTSSVTTALLFKNSKDSYRTFNQEAEYLWAEQESEEWYNLGKRTFECTKLMMSIQFYSIIQLYGKQVLEEYIDKTHLNAQYLAELIIKNDLLELAVLPASNIVCFRFFDKDIADKELNSVNAGIRQQLLEEGDFYIVQTILNGKIYLRTTLMNPFTTKENLKSLISKILEIAPLYS